MEAPQYSVMIARFPGGNRETPASVQWVLETNLKLVDDPRVKKPVLNWYKGDTPITMVRNEAVKVALDSGVDYLVMIDSDMVPDLSYPEGKPFWDSSWKFMMARREMERLYADQMSDFDPLHPATIAAPYCGPPPQENCYVFEWKTWETESPDANFRLEMIPRESAAIRGGFQEVAALPTGLILYDTRVFRVLDPPWFCYEYTDQYQTEKASTEDVYQTRNASLLRLPQFVNWDAWAGHTKEKVVKKPFLLFPDQIHETLVKFARGRINSDERLRFITPSPARVVIPGANGYSLINSGSTASCSPANDGDGAI